jgi:uncharacterized membrane protein YtjA (UPF0391 family)
MFLPVPMLDCGFFMQRLQPGNLAQGAKRAGARVMTRGPEPLCKTFVHVANGKECRMLYWALVFFIIAIIAGFFGFFGVAGAAAGIAKILFFVFLVLLVISLLFGGWRRGSGSI